LILAYVYEGVKQSARRRSGMGERMKKLRMLFLLFAIGLLAAPQAAAQSVRGSVGGVVKDSSGAVVPGARVTLTSVETNRLREASADAKGEFLFTLLAPDAYRLEAGHTGFRTTTLAIQLHVNQEVRKEISLAVAEQSGAAVEVRATPEVLRTQTAAVGAVIDNRSLTLLPLDGRNFAELSLLLPGVAPSAQGSASSSRGGVSFSVNGGREDASAFLLDGVYNGDPVLNTTGVTPPVDAILEFEVLTNGYDASFGRNSGGQINVALKSGSNAWHGTGYEFFRNAALDARNHFAPSSEPDPRYQRNQFGFSLGGPIRRDRSFFFVDYEGPIQREGITRITQVPTQAERSGDFTAHCFPVALPSCPVIPGFGQVPIIPPGFQHPVGAAIAALYPLPNRTMPGSNFVSSPTARDNDHQFDVRLDHRLASSSELAARFSFGDSRFFEPFSGTPGASRVPGYGNSVPSRAQNLMVGETHTFSPNLLNEFRFAFNRISASLIQENPGVSINQAVGLPEPSNPRDFGLSQINVTGFATLGQEINSPNHNENNTIQFLDHATWVRGRHTLKFGADFRLLRANAFRDIQSRGFLSFLGFITGNPLADLLLGLPIVTGRAIVDNPQNLRSESYHFFASDAWRVRPNLVLTAGLRYELISPAVDPNDRANVYDPVTGSLVQVGAGGVPRAAYESDRNNFGPRFGLAWTLPRLSGTVLRAGYGVYFDQSPLAPSEGLYFSPPFFNFNLFFQFPGLPPLTLTDPFPVTFPIPTPPSALAYQRDLRTPYVQHWSLSIQQKLGATRVFEAVYAGSKGTKLLGGRDINQPAPSVVVPNLRPNPLFDDITAVESRASSTYRSLQLRFQQNLDRGLTVLASYTLSKSLDDASSFFASAGDPNFPQDSNNVRAERARSNFDVRQRMTIAFSYAFPLGRDAGRLRGEGLLTALFGNWQTLGVLTFQDGRPFTVALLSTVDNSNTGRSVLGFGANDRPNVTGNPAIDNPSTAQWFNTGAFSTPAFGTFGNAGRNILEGPGLENVNFSLIKNIPAGERLKLQFRSEFFNLFNRDNFDLPDNFLGSPTFGQILSAGSPRHVQFGVKLLF